MQKIYTLLMYFCFVGFSVNAQNEMKINNPISVGGIDLSKKKNNPSKSSQMICDTIFNIPTNSMPTGLTWDGQYFWYVDTANINKITSTGVLINTYPNPAPNPTGFRGGDLCFDGINIWYVDEESAQLYKINPITGNAIQQFNLPSFGSTDPNGYGIAWDGLNLWHSQYFPHAIYKLNSINGSVMSSFVPTDNILGIEFVNGDLYGLNLDYSKIYKIDTNTGNFLDSSNWCVPFALGLTWNGSNFCNVSGEELFFGIYTGGRQRIFTINSDIASSVKNIYLTEDSFSFYPNPTEGIFTISQKNSTISEMEIHNISGELIYKTITANEQTTIDLSKVSKGIYFVKVSDKNRNVTNKKLIVQ